MTRSNDILRALVSELEAAGVDRYWVEDTQGGHMRLYFERRGRNAEFITVSASPSDKRRSHLQALSTLRAMLGTSHRGEAKRVGMPRHKTARPRLERPVRCPRLTWRRDWHDDLRALWERMRGSV